MNRLESLFYVLVELSLVLMETDMDGMRGRSFGPEDKSQLRRKRRRLTTGGVNACEDLAS
jgi:hypothetical protein